MWDLIFREYIKETKDHFEDLESADKSPTTHPRLANRYKRGTKH